MPNCEDLTKPSAYQRKHHSASGGSVITSVATNPGAAAADTCGGLEVGRKCKGSLQRRSGSTEDASGCVLFVSTAAAETRASSCAHSELAAREWLEVSQSGRASGPAGGSRASVAPDAVVFDENNSLPATDESRTHAFGLLEARQPGKSNPVSRRACLAVRSPEATVELLA